MGTHPMIYIRTDGNHTIAAGHIRRCLTIAEQILKKGSSVCFLLSSNESLALLETFAKDLLILKDSKSLPIHTQDPVLCALLLQHADYRDPQLELPELTTLLQKNPAPLLIDSYFVTEPYLKALHDLTVTAYMDDLMAFPYRTDLVINYDCFTDEMIKAHSAGIYQNIPHVLLGAQYAPLRPVFEEQKATIRPSVQNILVTTGSSDPLRFLPCFIRYDSQDEDQPGLCYHIVAGALDQDVDTLLHLQKNMPDIHIHTGLNDLVPLMLSCDLAVSAGGTTLYELCALGIPAISFSMADNQISNARAFHDLGILPYAGDIRTDMGGVLEKCFHFLKELENDLSKRKAVHAKMNSLINGSGAALIADALLHMERI